MPPKGRKSLSLWQSCEKCSSVISSKDLEVHDAECSLPNVDRNHSFISDRILYGILEYIKASDVPEKIAGFKEELILVSQSAMQLCNFAIGSNVVLVTSGVREVKKVWPKVDGLLTSVHLPEQGFLNGVSIIGADKSFSFKKVTVSNLKNDPLPAKEVHFEIVEPNENQFSDFLLDTLRLHSKGRIFFRGSCVAVPFYGKRIVVCVKDWSAENPAGISSLLDSLSLEERPFSVIETTQWVLCGGSLKESRETVRIGLNDFGGYGQIVEEIVNSVRVSLESSLQGRKNCYGILLHGCHGCGKTMLAEAVVNSFSFPSIKMQGHTVASQPLNEALRTIGDKFKEASSKSPSILVIDNLDLMTACDDNKSDKRLLTAALLSGFDSLEGKNVVFIATSLSPSEINPGFRRPGRIESEIELGVPTAEDRLDILAKYLTDENLKGEIVNLSKITHGYVGADLAGLCSQAESRSAQLGRGGKVDAGDLAWAMARITPSGMRQAVLQVSPVRWDEIGGQENLKLKLKQAVEWPLLYPESFKRLAITPPKGVLMFGPPGCSKTMIAKALATETSLNFISVKGSDIFSKWVGESEKSVRELFSRARRVSPCILFLDEVDALGSTRDSGEGSGGSAVQDRVLSQLLTEIDGVQPLNNVVIIAATNRPDRIDKALLRPGRLDRLIYVPLPDFDTRRKIFEIHSQKTPASSDVDIETLALRTEGYSGAEVTAVCNEAALKALEEDIRTQNVKMDHFLAALDEVLPRTPKSLLEIYEAYINKNNN